MVRTRFEFFHRCDFRMLGFGHARDINKGPFCGLESSRKRSCSFSMGFRVSSGFGFLLFFSFFPPRRSIRFFLFSSFFSYLSAVLSLLFFLFFVSLFRAFFCIFFFNSFAFVHLEKIQFPLHFVSPFGKIFFFSCKIEPVSIRSFFPLRVYFPFSLFSSTDFLPRDIPRIIPDHPIG